MRKYIAPIIAAALAAAIAASFAGAQPGIGITKTAPLSGSGTTTNPLKITVCANGEVYQSNGTSWVCAAAGSGGSGGSGTITGVTAGSGLTGGGTSGTVTVDVGAGSGIAVAADEISVNITGASCSAGQVMTALGATGTGTCTAIGTAGGVTGTGTANTITKFTGTTAVGNSSVTDDGTTFTIGSNKLTVTEATGNTDVAGTFNAAGALTENAARVFSIAGNGLTSTGATVDVAVGTGLSVAANAVNLNLSGASCSAGSFMSALGSTGSGTCTAATSIVTGTTNTMAKFTSSTAVGNSSVTDNGTTFAINTNKLTVTEASGNTAIAGTLDAVGAISENGARVFSNAGNGLSPFGEIVNVGQGTNITVNANDVALATNVAIAGTLGVASGLTTLSTATVTSTLHVANLEGTIALPTGLTGTMNDWAPTGFATATIIHAALSGNTSLTGIAGGTDGRKITLRNLSGGIITLVHGSASSLAANRITCPESANLAIRIGSSVDLFYDGATSLWYAQANTRYPNLTADSSLSSPGTNSLGNTTLATGTLTVTAGLTSLSGGTTATGTVNLGTVTTGTTTVKGPAVLDQTLAVTGNYTSAAGNLTLTAGTLTAGALLASSSSLQVGSTTIPTTLKGVLSEGMAVPVASSCGTSPVVDTGSGNTTGAFTIGTGAPTSCTLTFATAFPSKAACIVNSRNSSRQDVFVGTISGSAFTVNNSAGASMASITLDYICMGH